MTPYEAYEVTCKSLAEHEAIIQRARKKAVENLRAARKICPHPSQTEKSDPFGPFTQCDTCHQMLD